MKKSLAILLMMGLLLCGGQLFADDAGDDGAEPEMPELYDSSSQQVFTFDTVNLTEEEPEEEPAE